MLLRKLVRDLWGQRAQLLALFAVQTLGVGLFGASYAGYLNLRESYTNTRHELALAEAHCVVSPIDERAVRRVEAIPGIARAEGRDVFSFPVTIANGLIASAQRARLVLDGRFVSLPASGQPTLDRLHLLRGSLPTSENGVVLETHLAKWHGLDVGDHVEIRLPGEEARSLEVQGVAASAEYLWVSRDARDPMPSPDTFGVLWMREPALRGLARAYVAALRFEPGGGVAAAARGRFNELLYDRAPGAHPEQVDAAVDAALGPGVMATRTEASQLVGPRLLQLDVDGMRVMALFFPVFFLGVAGFISLALLARLVDQQRQLIGTLRALGLSRARVVAHTVAFGAVTGLISSLVGAAGGAALSREITRSYADELSIPFVTVGAHLGVVAVGIGFGLLTSMLAALMPAWRAANVQPAEAMRPESPAVGALVRASRHFDALPLWMRLALRNALRHPLRVAAAALGVVASLVLVVATLAAAQSIQRVADVQLHDAQRYDVRVDLYAPLPVDDLMGRLSREPAVADAELSLTLPVVARARGQERTLLLSAVPEGARLLRPVDFEGHPMATAEGILLPPSEARVLQVAVGDPVDVALSETNAAVRLTVTGIVDTAMGPVATMDLARARELLGLARVANTVAARGSNRLALRSALQRLPGVANLFDFGALRGQLDQLLALNVAMVSVMLVFAVILGGAILSTMAMLSILERSRELATLRALGMPTRALAAMATVENGLAGLMGLAFGLPLSRVAARATVRLFDSDLLAMPFVWSWNIAVLAGLGVLLVLLAAQIPALRGIARMNLAASVRSREG